MSPRPSANRPGHDLTVGIWLELPPNVPLRGEGVIQLVLRLLRQARDAGRPVVIATAVWTRPEVQQLLAEYSLAGPGIEVLTGTPRRPWLLKLYNRLTLPVATGRPHRPGPLLQFLRATFSLIAIPPVVLWRGFRRLARAAKGAVKFLVLRSSFKPLLWAWEGLRRGRRFARNRWASLRQAASRLRTAVREGLRTTLAARLHRRLITSEFSALVRRASNRRDISAWLVPNPGFRHAADLQAPRAVIVPDMVYRDFPELYGQAGASAGLSDDAIRSVVSGAAAAISHLTCVRDRHVVGYLGVPAAAAHVIPHAPMPIDSFLPPATTPADRRRGALAAIHDFLRQHDRTPTWTPFLPEGYLLDFPFHETPFLFYSSQIRPHKNLLNLFRAHELLLRRRYRNLKLVITGRLHEGQRDLCRFLRSRRLELDILSLYDLPPDVHAAFYLLADLSVVPTLAEGGFPFPFTESLSVGTPVVMSDIPAARSVIEDPLAGLMLFDPADPAAIADRIDWALTHRGELLQAEGILFEQLRRRTWDQVADEYLAVLTGAAGQAPAKEPHP